MITDHEINRMSLAEYLARLNEGATIALTTDLNHWSEYGITTARALATYLDECCEQEREKDARRCHDTWL